MSRVRNEVGAEDDVVHGREVAINPATYCMVRKIRKRAFQRCE